MKQVLLVEDDERLSSLICQYLTENDFIVHRLSSGENLLQHVQTSPPDILLLDVMLPGENGFSLCQKVRPYYPGPLLFMTAKNDDFDQVFVVLINNTAIIDRHFITPCNHSINSF